VTIPDFGCDEERLEKEMGGKSKTIYDMACELFPIAKKKYGIKTLRECYDFLVDKFERDDNSWVDKK
jgi:hypothetical protein